MVSRIVRMESCNLIIDFLTGRVAALQNEETGQTRLYEGAIQLQRAGMSFGDTIQRKLGFLIVCQS